jgi:hypothetical protein
MPAALTEPSSRPTLARHTALALATLALAARADAFVYWANFGTGTIGRADLDGSGANQAFITGASSPLGVAVDAPATPPTIADLIDSVEALELPHGIENSLLKKLTGAQRNLDADDLDGACDKLASFLDQVRAQSGKKIDAADADDLIAEAEAVRESLGCG